MDNLTIEQKVKKIFETLRELNCYITFDSGWLGLAIIDQDTGKNYEIVIDNFEGNTFQKYYTDYFPVPPNDYYEISEINY